MHKSIVAAVAALLTIAGQNAALACYCTPIVNDPENIAQTMEVVAKGAEGNSLLSSGNGYLTGIQGLNSQYLQSFGATGSDSDALSGISSTMTGTADIYKNAQTMASTASGICSLVKNILGMSSLLKSGLPTGSLLPTNLLSCSGSSSFSSMSGTSSWVTSTLRGATSSVTTAPQGFVLERQRRQEYFDATDQAETAALFHATTAATSSDKWSALNQQALDAATKGSTFRQQNAAQMLTLTQAIIALGEEMSAQRQLMASTTRLLAAKEFSTQQGVGQSINVKGTLPSQSNIGETLGQ